MRAAVEGNPADTDAGAEERHERAATGVDVEPQVGHGVDQNEVAGFDIDAVVEGVQSGLRQVDPIGGKGRVLEVGEAHLTIGDLSLWAKAEEAVAEGSAEAEDADVEGAGALAVEGEISIGPAGLGPTWKS